MKELFALLQSILRNLAFHCLAGALVISGAGVGAIITFQVFFYNEVHKQRTLNFFLAGVALAVLYPILQHFFLKKKSFPFTSGTLPFLVFFLLWVVAFFSMFV